MENSEILKVFVIYVFFVTTKTDNVCDPINGMAGNGEYCMLIPNYDTFQRAECGRQPFTTRSNKTEMCIDSCRDYCWLPCMVKEFDQHNGTVDPACACQGDTNQMCENVTGSVSYYTECANRTVPCSSPSYVDFAVFYFTWLSDGIVNGTHIAEPSCPATANKTAFRVCVENALHPLVTAENATCSNIDGNFPGVFNQCLREGCPMDYVVGINSYVSSRDQNNLWLGVQALAPPPCP